MGQDRVTGIASDCYDLSGGLAHEITQLFGAELQESFVSRFKAFLGKEGSKIWVFGHAPEAQRRGFNHMKERELSSVPVNHLGDVRDGALAASGEIHRELDVLEVVHISDNRSGHWHLKAHRSGGESVRNSVDESV